MRARSAALAAATAATAAAVSAGAVASAATAAGPPSPKAASGHPVRLVASGLKTPTSFAFGAGTVFEGDGGNSESGPPDGGVFVLRHGTATAIPGSPQFVAGLAWRRGTLYVSGGSVTGPTGATWQLQAWSGWNGKTFASRRVIYTAPKSFQGFNGLAFGPDGRLYVGADVGLLNHNDHGPASTPYVYDILSIQPNGRGLRVFATGIRQPWQLAFPAHSNRPYVSDLGQDSGAANPPDFVLRVRRGDDYGFPHCNWLVKRKCRGYTKPFRFFASHTDIMGLAIVGKRLYMTSFMGRGGGGPGGEVLSMSLNGHGLRPVVTGFVAPVVGLGAHDGRLYIGELTGQVFSVAP
jgi:glucose/arabinose dehydrogenase